MTNVRWELANEWASTTPYPAAQATPTPPTHADVVRACRQSCSPPLGTDWEPVSLWQALHGSAVLAPAPCHLRKHLRALAGATRVHSWGSRGRGFKSRRPDQNLQVRGHFARQPNGLRI